MKNLTPELKVEYDKILKITDAHCAAYGVGHYPVIYQICDWSEINEIAARGGFPIRYPHWQWGMEYEELQKTYSYGLSKIYEMVINTNPTVGYLLECNNLVDQKIVMAHANFHAVFFHENVWFSKTNRKMLDEMANHSAKIKRYMNKYGVDTVENFIDICLTIDTLIDPFEPFTPEATEYPEQQVVRLKSKDYMDKFINPPEFIKSQQDQIDKLQQKSEDFPSQPERDVLNFLIQFGQLSEWQRDILGIIREESYYFRPQAQTKIMNEGFAAFFHSVLCTGKDLEDPYVKVKIPPILNCNEIVDYADHNAGTLAEHGLNPYRLGKAIFTDIEERWNKGKFGQEYDECEDIQTLEKWDKKLGLGRAKVFEVMKTHNDITFLDEFLTPEFIRKYKFFGWEEQQTGDIVIDTKACAEIKKRLLDKFTNFGQPLVRVINGNGNNRNELVLEHVHDGRDLLLGWAVPTLESMFKLWGRKVTLLSRFEANKFEISYDGNTMSSNLFNGDALNKLRGDWK